MECLTVTVQNRFCLLDIIWKNCDQENWKELVQEELIEIRQKSGGSDQHDIGMLLALPSDSSIESVSSDMKGTSLAQSRIFSNVQRKVQVEQKFNTTHAFLQSYSTLEEEYCPPKSSSPWFASQSTHTILSSRNTLTKEKPVTEETREELFKSGCKQAGPESIPITQVSLKKSLIQTHKLTNDVSLVQSSTKTKRRRRNRQRGRKRHKKNHQDKSLTPPGDGAKSMEGKQHHVSDGGQKGGRKRRGRKRHFPPTANAKSSVEESKKPKHTTNISSDSRTGKKPVHFTSFHPVEEESFKHANLGHITCSLPSSPTSTKSSRAGPDVECAEASRGVLWASLNSALHKSEDRKDDTDQEVSEKELFFESFNAETSTCRSGDPERAIHLVKDGAGRERKEDKLLCLEESIQDLSDVSFGSLEKLRESLIHQIGGLGVTHDSCDSDSLLTDLLESSTGDTDQQEDVDFSRSEAIASFCGDIKTTILNSLLVQNEPDQSLKVPELKNSREEDRNTNGAILSKDVIYFSSGLMDCKHANPFNTQSSVKKPLLTVENRLKVVNRLLMQYDCFLKQNMMDKVRANIKSRLHELQVERELLKAYSVYQQSGQLLLQDHPFPEPLQQYLIHHNLLDITPQDCALLGTLPSLDSSLVFRSVCKSGAQSRDKCHDALAEILKDVILKPSVSQATKLRQKLYAYRRLQDKMVDYHETPGACCSNKEKLAFLEVRCCGLTHHIKLLEEIAAGRLTASFGNASAWAALDVDNTPDVSCGTRCTLHDQHTLPVVSVTYKLFPCDIKVKYSVSPTDQSLRKGKHHDEGRYPSTNNHDLETKSASVLVSNSSDTINTLSLVQSGNTAAKKGRKSRFDQMYPTPADTRLGNIQAGLHTSAICTTTDPTSHSTVGSTHSVHPAVVPQPTYPSLMLPFSHVSHQPPPLSTWRAAPPIAPPAFSSDLPYQIPRAIPLAGSLAAGTPGLIPNAYRTTLHHHSATWTSQTVLGHVNGSAPHGSSLSYSVAPPFIHSGASLAADGLVNVCHQRNVCLQTNNVERAMLSAGQVYHQIPPVIMNRPGLYPSETPLMNTNAFPSSMI